MSRQLAEAVQANDFKEAEKWLAEGHNIDLDSDDIRDIISYGSKASSKMIDYIYKLKALPDGISASTLKFVIYCFSRETSIQLDDFWGKPDLNLAGCPGIPSPMELICFGGAKVELIRRLILETRQRPIEKIRFNCSPTFLKSVDKLNLDGVRQSIRDTICGNKKADLCEILEIFLFFPTEDLEPKLENIEGSSWASEQVLFYSWLGLNNKAELLDHRVFQRLLTSSPDYLRAAALSSALFSSHDFIKAAILKGYFNDSLIAEILLIAAADNNLGMMLSVSSALNSIGKDIKAILNKPLEQDSINCMESAFFWAMRLESLSCLRFLIDMKTPLNIKDGMDESTFLHQAVRIGNAEVVKLLLDKGVPINQRDFTGKTEIYLAICNESCEIVKLLLDYGASTENIDGKNSLASEIAKKYSKHKDLVSLLQSHGEEAKSIVYESPRM